MSCEVCGKQNNLKSCGRCFKANYCGREHQLQHWKEHKRWCFKNSFENSNYRQQQTSLLDDNSFMISNDGQEQLMIMEQSPIQTQQQLFSSPTDNDDNLLKSFTDQQPQIMNILTTNNDSISDIVVNNFNNSNIDNNQQTQPHMMDLLINNNESMMMPSNKINSDIIVNNYNDSDIQQQSDDFLKSNIQNQQQPISNEISNVFFAQQQPQQQQQQQQHEIDFTNQSTLTSSQFNSQQSFNRDNILNDLNKYCQIILKDMNKYGFCVIDDFLQNGDLILNEVTFLYNKGFFQPGQVVNIKANSNSKLIRGDRITWVEGNEQICYNIGFLIRILDSIITRCNNIASGEFQKYRITRRTKAMIACYPSNYTKYVRHVDNPNNDGRCITSIYYLNKDYNRQRDGGVLRLFPQMNDGIVADIEPRFNRVIFFWSDRRNPHEVMPSTRMRFAITVWYFDANERERAIQKYRENSIQCPNDKDLVPF